MPSCQSVPPEECDVLVIGGGPAGLAAAISAREAGARRVVVIERNRELGGILQQCVHTGFGLHIFREELTGPEYAWRFIRRAGEVGVESCLNTMALNLTPDMSVYTVSPTKGVVKFRARAIVLAMGCRERTRGALRIPGARPAGIFTAGTAQRFVNIEGYMPGKRIVILGSGDIGMIMARRLTLEGAYVEAVAEIYPYVGGLTRNVVQCLEDYNIPLLLSHTVTAVHGKERVESVTLSRVDQNLRPIPNTEIIIPCDTLLLSVGLIPENELSLDAGIDIDDRTGGPVVDDRMETSIEGIFACGNAVHVNDLVDNVTKEGEIAGHNAARRALDSWCGPSCYLNVVPGDGIRYVMPQRIGLDRAREDVMRLHLRVTHPVDESVISLVADNERILAFRQRRARPGEIITLTLPPRTIEEFVSACRISRLVVEVKKVG